MSFCIAYRRDGIAYRRAYGLSFRCTDVAIHEITHVPGPVGLSCCAPTVARGLSRALPLSLSHPLSLSLALPLLLKSELEVSELPLSRVVRKDNVKSLRERAPYRVNSIAWKVTSSSFDRTELF